MRIVHLTDLHVQTAPTLADMGLKRFMGTVNLYVLGRRSKFSPQAQLAAVRAALDAAPDLAIVTGDLTSQSLDAEFEAARALLDPLLRRVPTVVIPGNHDVYVPEPKIGDRMRRWFGAWMGPTMPHRFDFGEVSVLTMETCRPHLLSAGRLGEDQLALSAGLLAQAPAGAFLFLAIHYPLRNRRGGPYGPATRALSNAAELEQFLAQQARVDAVLHGHEHHGFRTTIATGRGPIPVLDPGAAGYAFLAAQNRTAHLNVYEAGRSGLASVERLRFDGERFAPEPGGAYATGR